MTTRYSPLARSCGADRTDTTFRCPSRPRTLASSHFCLETLTTTCRVVGSSRARNTRPKAPLPSCRSRLKSPTLPPGSGHATCPDRRDGDDPDPVGVGVGVGVEVRSGGRGRKTSTEITGVSRPRLLGPPGIAGDRAPAAGAGADVLLGQHSSERGVVGREAGAMLLDVEPFALVFADQDLGKRQVEGDRLVGRQLGVVGQGASGIRGGTVEPGLDDLGGAAIGWGTVGGHSGPRESGAARGGSAPARGCALPACDGRLYGPVTGV